MTVTQQELGDRNDCEWMITRFKVLPCTRKGAHSWTECPFVHPGEKAARRCPLTHIYSADPCPDARKSGKCARGDACPYSHGVFEQWLHPSRFRTQLCSFGSACRRPICFFAHSVNELRVPTACGPNAGAVCHPSPALLAGAYTDPTAALAAAAVASATDPAQAAALQQALLSQINQTTAMQQLDGPTATMINRYQAASCAALANAAACQRQQQQHQAAAAAAAAAAIAAAANSSPASLLQMAQAAQAYQAAAAAAAAAAASITFPQHPQLAQAQQMVNSNPISSSSASSPTSSSSGQGVYDSYLLQQALAATKASSALQMPAVSSAAAGGLMDTSPWSLPTSAADLVTSAFGSGGLSAGRYPSGFMPTTPDVSDTSPAGASALGPSCGSLDALANQLSRQLSLAGYQA